MTLTVDKKGRIHLPAGVREKLGIASQVFAEKQGEKLVLTPINEAADPLERLCSLNIPDGRSLDEISKSIDDEMAGD